MSNPSTPELSENGSRVLRYPRYYERIGWIGSGFWILLLVALLLTPAREIQGRGICVFGGCFLLSLLLVWIARRCTIVYTDAEIHYAPLFGPTFSFAWESIMSAKYSGFARWWVFRLADGRTARVSRDMNGHQDFIGTARRRTSIPVPDAYWPPYKR